MSNVVPSVANVPEALQLLYLPVERQLAQAEQLLREELHSDFAFVDRLAQYGFHLGGKRLRPALVLLSAKAAGSLTPEHLRLAAAVELVHTASLIHDDVLDEATKRRHLETVNAKWDNEASVLLGDYLLAQSLCVLGPLDDTFAYRALAGAARTMCEGELRQIASRGNYTLDEQGYLEIIAGKTAALTACCCQLGAYYAGASEEATEALRAYGHHLGVAFQIADDLLDVIGDEQTVGKSLGTDLVKQKPTLPVIRLLSRLDGADRDELISALSQAHKPRREVVAPWLDRCDAVSYAREVAERHGEQAASRLASLPAGAARRSLEGLAAFAVGRDR